MVASVQSEITQMKSATAIAESKREQTATDSTDKNMFLKLMLQQLEYQDPTEPTSNEQWLAQLAQYSTLEEMQNLNSNFQSLGTYVAAIQESLSTSTSVSQTLSLIGKEVTLEIPDEANSNESDKITGVVTEASFEDGVGKIKVDGKTYSIGYITSIRQVAN